MVEAPLGKECGLKIPTHPESHENRMPQIRIDPSAAERVAVSSDILVLHSQDRAPALAEPVGSGGVQVKAPEKLSITSASTQNRTAASSDSDCFAPGDIRIYQRPCQPARQSYVYARGDRPFQVWSKPEAPDICVKPPRSI